MQKDEHWITPTWPASPKVKAFTTVRKGGVSHKPFDSFNLGDHVGDDPTSVLANRKRLMSIANLPQEPCWISQVHGTEVLNLEDYASLKQALSMQSLSTTTVPIADASISFKPLQVAVVLTADCLPILICDRKATRIAAVHAGWRGLAQGVIEATIAKLDCPSSELLIWLGPAIGPQAFEVGIDVKEAFTMEGDEMAFKVLGFNKWKADLYALAKNRLQKLGISQIYGGEFCTFTDEDKFFSFRKQNPTGRQATLIWLEE